MQWSPEIDKIAPALVKAQMTAKKAHKSGFNPAFKSNYSTLDDLFDACKEALHANGIVILQGARNDADSYGVETMLLHTSGQWFREILMLKPSRLDPQAAGSAISYAKRYTLAAMTGTTDGLDDDAHDASQKQATTSKQAPTQEVRQANLPFVQKPQKPLNGAEAMDRAMSLIQSGATKPPVARESDLGDYKITFGKKYSGRTLKEVDIEKLKDYCQWIVDDAEKKNQPVSGAAKELIAAVQAYTLGESEESPMPPSGGADDFAYGEVPIPF